MAEPVSSAAPDFEPPDSDEGGFSLDLPRILDALKKYFWVVLLFFIVCLVAAVAYLNVATPIYESTAVLKVEQRVMDTAPLLSGQSMATGDAFEDLRSLEMLATIQKGFLSRSLMNRIYEKLHLADRPGFLPADTPPDKRESLAAELLIDGTSSQVVRGTRLIQLSFDHADPELATQVCSALISEYVELDTEQRLKAASGNIDYLQREQARIEKLLSDSEEKLNSYTRKLGSVSVTDELNIIASQLIDLNTRLTVAKGERLKLEADFEQIEKIRDNPKALLQVASIAALPEIQALQTQINDLDGQLGNLRERYGKESPQLSQLLKQRDALMETLSAAALRAPGTLEISLRAAIQNEKSLERETKAQEERTIETKDLAIKSSVMQRQIDANKMAFEAVLQRLNEEQSQARSQPVFLQIVDPPSAAQQVKPRPLLVVAIALVLAMGLSVGTIGLFALLETSFKSVEEAERTLGVHVLSAIPELSAAEIKREKEVERRSKDTSKGVAALIPVLQDHHSSASEAFRTLRASLSLREDKSPFVLITSATPAEGKSFCSLNLAVAFSQQEEKTVIVDMDLRKPVIEDRIFGGRQGVGLSDFLMGRADFEDLIRETSIPNLFVIGAGKRYSNPAELLLRRERVQEFLQLIQGRFSRAVFDSAPVLAVSDTLNIANNFSKVCLVVRSHKTGRRLSLRAADLLARAGRPICGTVFNMVPSRASSYYYYYRYGPAGQSYGAPTGKPEAISS
jgi:capsular exopolysaccharide synthesis family protein